MNENRFTFLLILLILLGLGLTITLTSHQYAHEKIPANCSQAYDYPMCARADAPELAEPPDSASVYVSILIVLIISVLFVLAALSSSVMKQTDLIVTDQKPSAQIIVPAPTPLAAPPPPPDVMPAVSPNALPELPPMEKPALGMPLAPSVKPKQGVDLRELGGKHG